MKYNRLLNHVNAVKTKLIPMHITTGRGNTTTLRFNTHRKRQTDRRTDRQTATHIDTNVQIDHMIFCCITNQQQSHK